MGLITGLVRLGITAGAVYSAVRVADKYRANNPDGVEDKDIKLYEIKKAANEFYAEAVDVVKDKAPLVKDKVNDAVQRAADFATDRAPGMASKVQDFVDTVAEKAPAVAEKVQQVVETVTDKVAQYAENASASSKSAEENFDDVVDAEFEVVDEEKKD